MGEPEIRVSDQEREAARAALADHMAAGRLSMDEYDERSQAVLAARTRGELQRQFSDLPRTAGSSAASTRSVSPAHPDRPPLSERIATVSGPLSVVIFLVLGFAFDAWAWAWVVFLLSGVCAAWWGFDRRGDRRDR